MAILNRTKGAISWFKNKHNIDEPIARKIIKKYQESHTLKLGQDFKNRLSLENEINQQKQFTSMCNWFIKNKEEILLSFE